MRYNYDVNKLTRYIDVHKQFQGGLKTVDTDDALKDVYLREAENVSLSEFNFVEKRYGLHQLGDPLTPWASLTSVSSIVQGYFEYYVDENTLHKIIAIEGRFYVDQGAGWQQVTLFDSETGVAVDLSSLGIYVNQTFTGATNFASISSFGTQAPWFYTGNPNGVQLGAPGNVIHSTSNTIYVNTGTSALNMTWTAVYGAAFPFPGGLTQYAYYFDTRTNKYYRWNNATGTVGVLTGIVSIYDADFQTTRPIEGVRLDNKLYIATGTYPVYYKGDGKIYVFQQYEPSDLDVQLRGYDLNSVDTEGYLYDADTLTQTSSHGSTYDSASVPVRSVIFKELIKYPFLPYQLDNGKLNFEVAYHLYNNATYDYWTSGANVFDSSVTPATWNNPWAKWTLAGGVYTINDKRYELNINARVSKRRAGITVETAYETAIDKFTEFSITRSGTTYPVNKLTNDLVFGANNVFPKLSTDVLNRTKIEMYNLVSGYWDYRVEFVLSESSYRYAKKADGTDDQTVPPVFYTDETVLNTIEYTNIWITPEKLTDFDEAPLDTLRVHQCNRLTEHNGRLCFFGHPTHSDYLFFSDISAKEYIPYFYTIQFSNDLYEDVTTVNKFMNILVVQSESYTWGLKGDTPLPLNSLEGEIYKKITINPTIGCIAPHSVKNVRNQLFFLSKEGIFTLRALYAEDNRYNVDPIDRNIYNIVPRDTNAVSTYFDDQYWLHFPNTGETLRYYVDKKAWVKDTYAPWNDFGGVHKYINESGKLRFITELSQLEVGEPVKIFDVEVDYSLPTDLTKTIESKFTTSYLNQNYPFHPKNYKEAKFDFAIQNEYNTSMANLPIANYAETINYVQFTVDLIDRHFYSITFEPAEIGARPAAYTVEIDAVQVASGNITESAGNLSTIRFMSNKTGNVTVKITVPGKIVQAELPDNGSDIKLYDSTYDHSVTFNTLVISEEGTLNIDPINSYTTADVAVEIDLGTRTGNWTFGTSNFGNVIVAIKTVKLSGKGYNIKVSVIEDSKSKWTLESLGITYKMKKARST
jgi:hypothetical protein